MPDRSIISWENTLGPADAPGKGDHAGNIDSKRTIATRTQNTSFPYIDTDFFKHRPINLPFFLIKLTDGVNELVGRHIFRIIIVRVKQKTAFST